ncbi:MAG: cytochrome c biogenesis protein CcsA [Planctomycetaceae bacterium]|nr:cytochrome c biogenesis protein CcsA [Planctomycetaceae bacterium]
MAVHEERKVIRYYENNAKNKTDIMITIISKNSTPVLTKLFFFVLTLVFCPSWCSAQNWQEWSTVPVFDGGRTMPLSSFAQQIVEDICGTSKPFIVPDTTVLAELNRILEARPKREPLQFGEVERKEAFLPPSQSSISVLTDGGIDDKSQTIPLSPETSVLRISKLSREQAERILQRISSLLPLTGRYFDAPELLLSWFAEPEIWEYIPLFELPETDYRSEVLDIEDRNNARVPIRRVSVFQLEQSVGFQQRLDALQRSGGFLDPDESTRFIKITQRIAGALSVYQNLTFSPQRHYPNRMTELLHRAGNISEHQQSSYSTAFGAWNYLMNFGDDSSITATVEIGDSGQLVHPTMERWHAIGRKVAQLSTAFDRLDEKGNRMVPNLSAVERQFELLFNLLDINLDESAAFMEKIYPGVSFQRKKTDGDSTPAAVESVLPKLFTEDSMKQNKEMITQLVLTYYYSVKHLRSEIEAAYLALYDNGRTLRVLPLITDSYFSDSSVPRIGSPWASMQLVLHGGDSAVRRFLYAEFQPGSKTVKKIEAAKNIEIIPDIFPFTSPEGSTDEKRAETPEDMDETETETSDNSAQPQGNKTDSMKSAADERYEINLFDNADSPVDFFTAAALLSPNRLDAVRKIRNDFYRLYVVFTTPRAERVYSEFNERGAELKTSLRSAAEHSASFREKFYGLPEGVAAQESAKKTAYPSARLIASEYRYFSFSPFFWMWVFAAASAVSALISLIIGIFRRGMIDARGLAGLKQNNVQVQVDRPDWDVRDKISWRDELFRPDMSNSPEEYFLWLGFILLSISIFITFIGGVMRALISGWAPVTNMYETVVFLAFAASLLGMWYTLYPIVKPLASLAWQFSSLPSYKTFRKRFNQTVSQSDWNSFSQILDSGSGNRYSMKQSGDSTTGNKKVDLSSGIYSGSAKQVYGTRSGIFHPGGIAVGNADNLVDTLADPLLEREKKLAKSILYWQFAMIVPRLALMFLTFIAVVLLSYGEHAGQFGIWAAAKEMLTIRDWVDWITVLFSIGVIVWFVPQIIISTIVFAVLLFRPNCAATDLKIISFSAPKSLSKASGGNRSEMESVFNGESLSANTGPIDNSGLLWLNLARNKILSRKLLVFVAAVVALIAGLAAYLNSAEFNPNIRPLMAVLRSNFWLTVHVVAIIVSYAAAFVAWGMALLALGGAIFGRYRYITKPDGTRRVQLPEFCDPFVPSILKLLRLSLILLVMGTILGARWADYSWGRFWSWDPKEVWALITILFLAIVLHGRIARYYGAIGVTVGALWTSIAVIITWYGINFVFKGSIHSYGGGSDTGAAFFLWTFIALNLIWAFIAVFRYNTVSTFVQEHDAISSGK